ncbi:MAG: hypothetical protein ACLRMV_05135 [Lachnospiraceae bacterium]
MRKKLSKKQIGAMGLAVMMGVQTPAMAAETSQESTTQETVLEPQTEEGETVQVEITESQTAESQIAEAETEQATTTEYQAEEVNETETQTEETAISTENAESQVEEASEQVGQAEQETEAEVAVLEAAEEDGWHQNDDGSRYYVKDGEVLRGCVEKIGDSYYGFESDGTMYIDSEFTILNEEINRVYYYRAKADGSLYVNEWYIPDEWSKCYYGADGKVYIGVQTVNGKQYYFREAGWLCVDTTVTSEDGRAYACDEEGIATELINNDWTKIDGKRYYVKDGQVLKECIEKIGDFYYAFKYNGVMYADDEFSIWNEETEEYDKYRAKADGSLYVNEWYILNEWNTYYYGADGKRYSGLQTIEGKQYYFDESGWLYKDTIVTIEDGKLYLCDEEGVATELANNDWTEVNGEYYYVKDGQVLKECIEKIGDFYYGFGWKGAMYADREFSIWNEETRESHYYRAKADGSLYVNEWYVEGSHTYYYGADGTACRGLCTIDGKIYYFNESNWLCKDTIITAEDGTLYYCGEDGAAMEIEDNSWIQVNGKHYYIKNGEILRHCVEKIGDSYYGFDWNGDFYPEGEFYIWDSETGKSTYYYASADGSVYTNRWGVTASGWSGPCYYGADGKRCSGGQTIDGVQYVFYDSGSMYLSTFTTVDGACYYCDAEGKAEMIPDNQLYYAEDGYWYYIQNGNIVRSCSLEINGKKYSFDLYGRMQTMGMRVNSDGTYRDYISTWVSIGDNWLYYGEDGHAYKDGIYEIEGVKYHFANEYMSKSEIVKDGDIYYVAAANGALTQIPDNGWVQIGTDYYYAENGAIVKSGIRKVNNVYYAFDKNGKMYADGEYECGSVTCRARADGSLYVLQWYQDVDGSWYYYDQNADRVKCGKATINGNVYLFDSTRTMKVNGVVQDGDNYYLADENGLWVQTPGWVQKDGNWYYVRSDGSLCTDILEDRNVYYYLNPVMETNVELKSIDGVLYNIDAAGHLAIVPDGFYKKSETVMINSSTRIVEHLYYVSDGKIPQKGWKVIDGNWYYFEDLDLTGMCRPVVGCTYKIDDKYYLFNADGTMVSNGWKLVDDVWYYASASGALATEDTVINGTLYHFDENGAMQEETEKKTGVVVEDGKCNFYSEDGILLKSETGQGWHLFGGAYYYLQEDKILKDVSYKLPDGKWYRFDSQGRMLANTFYEEPYGSYWYGESGAALTGWFMLAGNWYYASTVTGRLYTGYHIINGVKYYFDRNGIMQNKTLVTRYPDCRLSVIDASGAVTDIKVMEDGWSYYNGEWYYYYNNGCAYYGWVDDYYVNIGIMYRNSVVTSYDSGNTTKYYVGEDGTRQKNTWCEDEDGLYYAKADGTLARNEWLNIDGKLYYFDDQWKMSTKKLTKKGAFTEDGQYFSPDGYAQGWVFVDGNYYYKEGEDFVSNQSKKINGDWYLFDLQGKMVTGFSTPEITSEYDDNYYYYGNDGRRQFYTGWQLINGKWYYFDESSRAAKGWKTINGVKYYFETITKATDEYNNEYFVGNSDHFMYTGYGIIDGEFYYFDANGACQGIDTSYTGWHLDDNGKWYYIRNGHAVTGTTVIDGVLYEFDGYGVWNLKS